jgi:hypothetical protein
MQANEARFETFSAGQVSFCILHGTMKYSVHFIDALFVMPLKTDPTLTHETSAHLKVRVEPGNLSHLSQWYPAFPLSFAPPIYPLFSSNQLEADSHDQIRSK